MSGSRGGARRNLERSGFGLSKVGLAWVEDGRPGRRRDRGRTAQLQSQARRLRSPRLRASAGAARPPDRRTAVPAVNATAGGPPTGGSRGRIREEPEARRKENLCASSCASRMKTALNLPRPTPNRHKPPGRGGDSAYRARRPFAGPVLQLCKPHLPAYESRSRPRAAALVSLFRRE